MEWEISDLGAGVYNLGGRMLRRVIVNIYRDQNISKSTIYRTTKEYQEYVNLPKCGPQWTN
ncbi:hypothetical protein NQ317_019036 [Molorchus minor]|uniref:Uncharacterized protein n=1 Tax=Molorchus minor TaxID=1323400 RepID=A0ABQ9ISP6_9CUCU|nr:hypothetical protein NQ317_019036 [Molorchus minor]